MELRIKDELKKSKLTASLLAKKIEITEANLSKITNGKLTPSLQTLEKIASALEIPVWQLFSGSESAMSGFIEFKGEIYKVHSVEDLKKLLALV